jgi:hypothetical protein
LPFGQRFGSIDEPNRRPATGSGRPPTFFPGECKVAKGQLRSNKEAKKPKQPKPKNPLPASPFASTQARATGTGKKK